MESTAILQADLLDIIFDGRNKDYGAYALRRDYERRMRKALAGTGICIALLIAGYYAAGLQKHISHPVIEVNDVNLDRVVPKEDKSLVIQQPKPVVQVRTIPSTTPRIVPADQVHKEDMPPTQDQLDQARIGTQNLDGSADDGTTGPTPTDTRGVTEAPKQEKGDFIPIEIESTYPGGAGAWARYLNKSLHYPEEAVDKEIQGDVIVQFVVDVEGSVSNVEALSGPDELRDEAVRIIRKSGKWIPALQNGRQVRSYKKQPIKFRLDTPTP